jgi:sugar lactone lactonase YvrE
MRGWLVPALCIATVILSASCAAAGRERRATATSINGPGALATDNRGHLFVIEIIKNKVLRIDLQGGKISTVAGNGKKCCYKEGAKATEVSLNSLLSLAVDAHGNLFIGEGNQIRVVDGSTGFISTVAGDAMPGNTVNGISARSAHFWGISGLAVDSDGNLFAADQYQAKIFKIDVKNGTVRIYAGSDKSGYEGDGGLAVDAGFRFPSGLATDKGGNLIVADFENCAIRRVDRETGVVKTVAVTGGAEQNCVERPDNSRPGAFPSHPASDVAGNIYFAEGSMDFVMRIDASTFAVSVVAGNGHRGFSGDNSAATQAQLDNPSGLAIDLDGNVFIAEYGNNRVRRVDAKSRVITTVAGNGRAHRSDVAM